MHWEQIQCRRRPSACAGTRKKYKKFLVFFPTFLVFNTRKQFKEKIIQVIFVIKKYKFLLMFLYFTFFENTILYVTILYFYGWKYKFFYWFLVFCVFQKYNILCFSEISELSKYKFSKYKFFAHNKIQATFFNEKKYKFFRNSYVDIKKIIYKNWRREPNFCSGDLLKHHLVSFKKFFFFGFPPIGNL